MIGGGVIMTSLLNVKQVKQIVKEGGRQASKEYLFALNDSVLQTIRKSLKLCRFKRLLVEDLHISKKEE